MRIHDETVEVPIFRNGNLHTVRFCELRQGDVIAHGEWQGTVVAEKAHSSGDSSYNGWLFYAANGDSFFPEDFGAPERADGTIKIEVCRSGVHLTVPFSELAAGDTIADGSKCGTVVMEDAHLCGDEWLIYAIDGDSLFPEDLI